MEEYIILWPQKNCIAYFHLSIWCAVCTSNVEIVIFVSFVSIFFAHIFVGLVGILFDFGFISITVIVICLDKYPKIKQITIGWRGKKSY